MAPSAVFADGGCQHSSASGKIDAGQHSLASGKADAAADVAQTAGQALESISDAIDQVNSSSQGRRANDNEGRFDDYQGRNDNDEARFDAAKDKTQFRQYDEACNRVKAFYKEQHEKQTVAYNMAARARFHSAARSRPEMSIWQAMEKLNTLVDESDPDTSLSQIEHLLQAAEALRRDGKPRWMQLTGLIHDLGKLMLFFPDLGTQGQWDVVGDTFPVGCAFDRRIVMADSFAANPDATHAVYGTELGIYPAGCGLDAVMLSWGHDEYLYHVVRDQSTLPNEALAMIRYHSFYPWHREGAYRALMCDRDWAMLKAVQAFNPYDLYSKDDAVPSVEELKPYYLELIDEFFPQRIIKW